MANAGHVSLGQLKVMSAIERCRTAALGGHVARCQDCSHTTIAYNSCRNRHCPKCQGAAAKEWLAERQADLLPAPYFHVVFTLPAAIADIAYQNKAVIYDILFKGSAETLITIAADPKHLGARIGVTSVLHTWGSAMTHHPHVHMIVPGGGLSADGQSWIPCTIRTQSTRSVSPRRCRSLERSLRCGAGEVTRAFPEAEMVQAMGPASCRGLAPCRTDHAPERGQPGSSTRCRFVPATARSGWTRLTAVSSTTCRFLFPILDPR
jgi:hypothetical protein